MGGQLPTRHLRPWKASAFSRYKDLFIEISWKRNSMKMRMLPQNWFQPKISRLFFLYITFDVRESFMFRFRLHNYCTVVYLIYVFDNNLVILCRNNTNIVNARAGYLTVPYHITVGFWCQVIHKKILRRFDTSFVIKLMVKIYVIEIIFKSHEPFQSYQLPGPANLARKAG